MRKSEVGDLRFDGCKVVTTGLPYKVANPISETMPLQNRANPFGGLDADGARGAWLGNRGMIRDDHERIVAQWRTKAWITCELHFRGVHREVCSPHTWSELFFLNEATAFAAGHRPCAYCRRQRYNAFKRAWCEANAGLLDDLDPRITVIDAQLHIERVTRYGHKLMFAARFDDVPPGAFIALDGGACLIGKSDCSLGRTGATARPGHGSDLIQASTY